MLARRGQRDDVARRARRTATPSSRAGTTRVTRLFFDEVHTITKVESKIDGDSADVEVVVNWQAKVWNPPEPKSKWLGFDAYQTWVVVRSPETGAPVIKRYAVDKLDAMPGSETL